MIDAHELGLTVLRIIDDALKSKSKDDIEIAIACIEFVGEKVEAFNREFNDIGQHIFNVFKESNDVKMKIACIKTLCAVVSVRSNPAKPAKPARKIDMFSVENAPPGLR